MKNVFFIDNVLPADLIMQIKNYIANQQPGLTNHYHWHPAIVRDSARVDVFQLHETSFKEKVVNCYSKYFDLKQYPITHLNYYKWRPGSFIPFHNDHIYNLSSTIYLNESWEIDYGGLFLYKEDENIKGYVPKYNSAVINNKNVPHGTSITSKTSPTRETLQIFFEEHNPASFEGYEQ